MFFNLSHALQNNQEIEIIAEELDQLSPEGRVEQSRSLGSKDQKKLWTLCEGRVVTLEQIVPKDRIRQTVRHLGRNTLPAFKLFEKRFMRVDVGQVDLWGYNEGPTRNLVGPGYFVCRQSDQLDIASVIIDYEQLPPQAPEGWPEIKPNDAGVSRLVYAYMHDYLRKVSEHVTIGRAYRKGKESPNYFTLCRWDEE